MLDINKKGVVFDFDGVIINSSVIQKYALLESYQIIIGKGEPSVEQFFSFSGDSLENIFSKMGLPLEMIEPYRRISREQIDLIKIHPGMQHLLEHLQKNGYKCALCTGKDRERTIEILHRLSLKQFFDYIICSDEVKNPKPHEESLLRAIQNLNININNAVMVGDSINDIICAQRAGVKSIAVTWGDNSEQILSRQCPDVIAKTVKDLSSEIIRLLEPGRILETCAY
jgi:3-amino-5-hydroxybenzoic acid synthesis related protein